MDPGHSGDLPVSGHRPAPGWAFIHAVTSRWSCFARSTISVASSFETRPARSYPAKLRFFLNWSTRLILLAVHPTRSERETESRRGDSPCLSRHGSRLLPVRRLHCAEGRCRQWPSGQSGPSPQRRFRAGPARRRTGDRESRASSACVASATCSAPPSLSSSSLSPISIT